MLVGFGSKSKRSVIANHNLPGRCDSQSQLDFDLCGCDGDFYTAERYKPFRRPSCQAREEKRKFSPTATSLRRRRQRSRTWATAQRALAEERKWRPKVHQARRDDRFSSRFLSLLLTAAIVPTRPTPLLLCSPLPLSLSDQVWCIQRCDCVNCT